MFTTFLNFLFPPNQTERIFASPDTRARIAAATPNPQPFISSVFHYGEPAVRKAIRILKQRPSPELIRIFGAILADHLVEELAERYLFEYFRAPLIIPIPVSKQRLRDRGFNQSVALASAMVTGKTDWRLRTNLLIKTKETKKQALIKDRTKRLQNIVGCFSVRNKPEIAGQNIVLVDDVTTTGATLLEARELLLHSGAKSVIAITIAH